MNIIRDEGKIFCCFFDLFEVIYQLSFKKKNNRFPILEYRVMQCFDCIASVAKPRFDSTG